MIRTALHLYFYRRWPSPFWQAWSKKHDLVFLIRHCSRYGSRYV